MTDKPTEDNLFARPRAHLVDFAFDEQVAQVFPDMIRRSVPGYETVIAMLGVFASDLVRADTRVYDLGCSQGAATLALRRHIEAPGVTLVAVDNSALRARLLKKLKRFKKKLKNAKRKRQVAKVKKFKKKIKKVKKQLRRL